jgi:hypothetical protein
MLMVDPDEFTILAKYPRCVTPGRIGVSRLTLADVLANRTVMIKGEPWWVAADVCAVLEIENSKQAVARLEKDDVCQTYTLRSNGRPYQMTKTFPDAYFLHIFRLKGKRPPKDGNLKYTPWISHINNDLIYKRLDVGVLEALNLLNPLIGRYRARKQHQYIATGEAKQQFKFFLGECVGVMASFSTYAAFLERWDQLHPKVNNISQGVEFHFADDQTLWLPFEQGLVPAEKLDPCRLARRATAIRDGNSKHARRREARPLKSGRTNRKTQGRVLVFSEGLRSLIQTFGMFLPIA